MINLISAHLSRLRKSPIFYLCLIGMYCVGFGLVGSALADFEFSLDGQFLYARPELWGQPLCGPAILIGFGGAALFALFFGTEYADGTIRSKLITGHSRTAIYFATLITGVIASFLLYLAALAAILLPGFMHGLWRIPAPDPAALILSVAGTILIFVAHSAVFTMLSMLIHRRAVLAVVLILLIVLMFYCTMKITDAVGANRGGMTLEYMGQTENGEDIFDYVYVEPVPNGPVLTFLTDFFPGYQAYRYMDLDATPRTLACSALLIVLTTGAGLILFKRKDIK